MIRILDTDILSLLRRPERVPQLVAWRGQIEDATLHLTVVTLGEIERGIHRQRRINPVFAAALADWAQAIHQTFADRILDFDRSAARVWGRLTAERGYQNADLVIAAISHSRDAILVTRNVADFAGTGVRVENPF